jgi:hypothetical protein
MEEISHYRGQATVAQRFIASGLTSNFSTKATFQLG